MYGFILFATLVTLMIIGIKLRLKVLRNGCFTLAVIVLCINVADFLIKINR